VATLAIFNEDAFSLAQLTAAVNELPAAPSQLGDEGLFEEEGVTTTSVQVEKQGDTLTLVSAGERGTMGSSAGKTTRSMLTFSSIYLPQTDVIRADEVTNVRAFGTESDLEMVQNVVNARQAKQRRRIEITQEYHRIGAVRGQVLDADGQTVLVDINDQYQIQRPRYAMNVSNSATKLRIKCNDVEEMIEDALGGTPYMGALAWCGKSFWAGLMANEWLEKTYFNTAAAAQLRDKITEIRVGDLSFRRYRGSVGGMKFVPDDRAYCTPLGVPQMFITRYAPADHVDAVGTMGLPFYSSIEMLDHGKGVSLHSQSNPITLCTRPGAVVELFAGDAVPQ
jgi:hypothetical protein